MLNRQLRENLYIATIAYAAGLIFNSAYQFVPQQYSDLSVQVAFGLFALSGIFPPHEKQREVAEAFAPAPNLRRQT